METKTASRSRTHPSGGGTSHILHRTFSKVLHCLPKKSPTNRMKAEEDEFIPGNYYQKGLSKIF